MVTREDDKAVSVAEVKRRFSEFLSRVELRGERILIKRRGKPVALLVRPGSREGEHGTVASSSGGQRRGLLAVAGVWSEMQDIDGMVRDIYEARLRAADRDAETLR